MKKISLFSFLATALLLAKQSTAQTECYFCSIDNNKIFTDLEADVIYNAKDIFDSKFEYIVILPPYVNQLGSDDNVEFKQKINEFLINNKYQADESTWSILLHDRNAELFLLKKFKNRKIIDIDISNKTLIYKNIKYEIIGNAKIIDAFIVKNDIENIVDGRRFVRLLRVIR